MTNALKLLAFACAFFSAVVWSFRPADGGVIELTVVTQDAQQEVDLFGGGNSDWAVWGFEDHLMPLRAQADSGFVGLPPLSRTLTYSGFSSPEVAPQISQPFVVTSDLSVSGGVMQSGPAGALTLFSVPEWAFPAGSAVGTTQIDLYFGTINSGSRITVSQNGEFAVYETPFTEGVALYRASALVTGPHLVSFSAETEESYDGAVFVSAATFADAPLAPRSVPEFGGSPAGVLVAVGAWLASRRRTTA